jgi:hypothetical protein
MLEITIQESEFFDEGTMKLIPIPECTFTLEHSLISLAKWESKWQVPYFGPEPQTKAQDLDYIRCMVVGPIKNERAFESISSTERMRIQKYISAPMTATTFSQKGRSKALNKEVITAEVIYSRMFSHSIPIECQKWHLNRLLTLIKVCDLQNAPKEKMSKKQTAMWNAEQNAARRAKLNTKG